MEKPILQDSPSFVDLCTLHQHAMRYYRLWIYACNTVLALATLIFSVFAVSVLVDPRISLLSGVELYQPTFIYAYFALILQCGVLQAIGCIGALRLNQRLLNTYWTLLLVLMIGDILVGLVWAFRLDQIKSNLRPNLKRQLITLYGKDQKFTDVWNWVQSNDSCCGVYGPGDFLLLNESAYTDPADISNLANDTWQSYLRLQEDRLQNQDIIPKLPSTCCIFTMTFSTSPETTTTQAAMSASGSSGGAGWIGDRGGGNSMEAVRRNSNNFQKPTRMGFQGEERWNNPVNRKPLLGFYHEEPQQLKGMYYAGNINKDPPEESQIFNQFKSNDLNDSHEKNSNSNRNNSSSPILASKLIVSDLRHQPPPLVTDQYPLLGAPMGYYGTAGGALPPNPIPPPYGGGSNAHNRRKISHAKKLDEYGYIERTNRYNQFGGLVKLTTTNSPPPPKPSPATIGVCVLPKYIQELEASATMSSSRATESPEEESGESTTTFSTLLSSTSTVPPTAFTTTMTSSESSTKSSEAGPSSTTRTTSVPSAKRPPPYPFTVTMDQHGVGCGDKILEWVEHSADVLFVIGFCIIVFLKGCFIAILRYEIKEMIEKIKLLNGEENGASQAMNELIGLTSTYEASNGEDGPERVGLMSDAHNNNQDTSYSNQETIPGGGGNTSGSGNGLTVSSTTIRNCEEDETHGRKDSTRANHKPIGGSGSGSRQLGNHVGCYSTTANKHEIEDDFDSGSALLGDSKHPFGESPPLIDINKHSPLPGMRESSTGVVMAARPGFPKNGNNNNSSNVSSCTSSNRTATNIEDVRMAISSPILLHPNNANAASTSSH